MTKPIGYYTSYTPGDDSYLESLQEKYGATFEQMTKREKFYLLGALASQLCVEQSGETRNEIYELATEANVNLSQSDRAGLIEALIAQLRWGQQHEPVVHNS
jgi:hypothetical protein